MTLLIGDNLVVSMHYTLTDEQGTTLDSSDGGEPLAYLHGAGNIIPGLEKALVGKTAGDTLTVTIAPEEGYGEVNPELTQTVPRAAFEGVDAIEAGMAFEARGDDGAIQRIVVTGVEEDQVTIDANHPLAGVTLHFAVEVVSVREATDQEKQHGHAH